MRTMAKALAVMCVFAVWLAMPAGADACGMTTPLVATSWSGQTHKVVVAINVQFDLNPTCLSYYGYDHQTRAFLSLDTPSTTIEEDEWGDEFQSMAAISISPTDAYEGGWGWYDNAQGFGKLYWCDYVCDKVDPTEMWYDTNTVYVPTPFLELDGLTSAPQYSGPVAVTASVDPWFVAPLVQWQGCLSVGGYPYTPYCMVDTDTTGVKTVTAKIDNGPTEQWFVDVY